MSIGTVGSLLVGGLALVVSLGCVDDYNPFSDTANAGVFIDTQSFSDGDTVSIFAAETLEVMITVKERVDSLVVACTANRRWAGIDTTLAVEQFQSEPLPLIVSFYDTGAQWVALTALEGSTVMSAETLSVYVVSPLAQDTVRGMVGGTLPLRTTPVGDADVRYTWSFGAGTVIESSVCSTEATVILSSPADSGTLWVTDGQYRSPAVPFVFSLDDTVAPTIACVNADYTGGDTIRTGSAAFNFKVEIVDDEARDVETATIDGGAFDDTVGEHHYLKLFPDIRTYDNTNPLPVAVRAADAFGNVAARTFYLVYNDTLPAGAGRQLRLTYPASDSTTTGGSATTLIGLVESTSNDSERVVLEIARNDSVAVVDTLRLSGTATGWFHSIELDEGLNRLAIRLLDTTGGDTQAVCTSVIDYQPGLTDSTPPELWYVRVGEQKPVNAVFYVAGERAVMKAYGVDVGSGLAGISFDDSIGHLVSGWYYSDTITAPHLPEGIEVVVRAEDLRGNQMQQTFAVVSNRTPVFDVLPVSDYIRSGDTYFDTIGAVDADGDGVRFSKQDGPAAMSVTNDGQIMWAPAALDTGVNTVKIRAYDGYQAVFYTYSLYVSDSASLPPPVRFLSVSTDLPAYLVADKDTLAHTLHVDPHTGIPPYRFSARFVGSDDWLLRETLDSQIVWVPGASATGRQQLIVVVRDNVASSDTIYPALRVVPPNRPCSLSVSFAAPSLPDGVIDLNAHQQVDTLRFLIHDPDDPVVERHRVYVHQLRSGVTSEIDSAVADSFRVLVDPRAFDGFDTIRTIVEDVAGHSDTLDVALYCGEPPDVPVLLAPTDGEGTVARPVSLSWQASDPDGDTLTFEVYGGQSASELFLVGSTADTTYSIAGLAAHSTYFWRIVAHDWKGATASETWEFTTQ